ncbi:histone deacetylase family protein [Pseudomonas sp. PB3P13]
MITIYSDVHRAHFGQSELINGQFHPSFECPSRADKILDSVQKSNLGEVQPPEDFGLEPIFKIQDPKYVSFLKDAWERWVAEGNTFDLLSLVSPINLDRSVGVASGNLLAQMGWYSFDTVTPVTSGSWDAAYTSAQIALTAQKIVKNGSRSAFALCRPPGHHAGRDYLAGFCYFNNAAIAAQAFLDDGAKRVTILDVDYHHGNGTQDIFYKRSDVQFISIHGDPSFEYPFYTGGLEERGEGGGVGFNSNYPLPAGSDWDVWSSALNKAIQEIKAYSPDALVVSLGVDTFKEDPISQFLLESDDFTRMGETIGNMGLPTLFVQEGGYAVGDIGLNVVNVLKGFETSYL